MRIALILVLLPLAVTPAFAKDYEEEGRVRDADDLVARISALRTGDPKRLVLAMKEVPELHNELKTKTAMSKLRKAIETVLDDDDESVVVRIEAVRVMGGCADESGVWKALKPHLPAAKDEAANQLELATLKAIGEAAPTAAIKALEDLSRSAKDPQVAQQAIFALGRYGYSKQRVKVLKSLMSTLIRLRPGNTRDVRAQSNRARYDGLRGSLVSALDSLTGRRVEGVELWLELFKEHKKSLEKLFVFER